MWRKTIAAGAAVMILAATGTAIQDARWTSDCRTEVIAGTIAVRVRTAPNRMMVTERTEVVAVAIVQLRTETTVTADIVQLVTGVVLEGLLLLLLLMLGCYHRGQTQVVVMMVVVGWCRWTC